MCGRYTNTISIKKLAERFGFSVVGQEFSPRYNIAPGQEAPVVLKKSPNRLAFMRWGLVPSWAKDPKTGYKMINARSETLDQKASFKRPFQRQRCLVLADSFYEWQKTSGKKTKIPMRILLKSREPFAFAGLWEHWKDPKGKELHTFTIVTTEANPKLRAIHDRMPALLSKKDENLWLDPSCQDLDKLKALLKPYPQDQLEAYPVSTIVNSPKNDTPQCIEKVES